MTQRIFLIKFGDQNDENDQLVIEKATLNSKEKNPTEYEFKKTKLLKSELIIFEKDDKKLLMFTSKLISATKAGKEEVHLLKFYFTSQKEDHISLNYFQNRIDDKLTIKFEDDRI